MNKQQIKAVALSTVLSAGAIFAGTTFANSQTLNEIVAVSNSKVSQAQKSQTRINKLQDETNDLIAQFKQVNKNIEGLRAYNAQYEKRIDNKRKAMDALEQSISQVTIIQRQIPPYVEEMLDGIEQFIELDSPYRKEERLNRVADVREKLDDPNVSVSEQFRQVLEVYKIESEYARSIDSYPNTIKVNGQDLTVNIIAVGRIALMYQTEDGSMTGAWDKTAKQWVELDPGQYKKAIRNAIRIAQKKAQNDIMLLPVAAPEAAK